MQEHGISRAVVNRVNIGALRELGELRSAVRHWRRNHDMAIERTALLLQREDLPVDRIPAYRRLVYLQHRVTDLEAEVARLRSHQFSLDRHAPD